MKGNPETILKRQILDALRLAGIVVWNSPSGTVAVRRGRMSLAPIGTPDLIGYLPGGRMLALEVKLPAKTSKPSPEQTAWLAAASKAGVTCGVVRSAQQALALARQTVLETVEP